MERAQLWDLTTRINPFLLAFGNLEIPAAVPHVVTLKTIDHFFSNEALESQDRKMQSVKYIGRYVYRHRHPMTEPHASAARWFVEMAPKLKCLTAIYDLSTWV